MFSSPLPASWVKKKMLIGASGFTAVVAAFLLFGVGNTSSYVRNGVPLPFIQQGTVLQGKVTFLTKRNNIDIYDVTFKNGEVQETLLPDKIYLVHIPNDSTITASPIDLAMTLAGTLSHNVDYYGYRYSDASATAERRDIAAARFKDRFPGQFFASAKARAADAEHGNALAQFENANDIVFHRTDNIPGGVRIDPAGALYIIIANETSGIDMNPRRLAGCGNAIVEGVEECDDGNTIDNDSCRNDCTLIPLPFGSSTTSTSTQLLPGDTQAEDPLLTLTTLPLPEQRSSHTGTIVPLVRFSVTTGAKAVALKNVVFTGMNGGIPSNDDVSYLLGSGMTEGDYNIPTLGVCSADTDEVLCDEIPSPVVGSLLPHSTYHFQLYGYFWNRALADVSLKLAASVNSSLAYAIIDEENNYSELRNIRMNGVCATATCEISITTIPSTNWTIGGELTAPVCNDMIIDVNNNAEECDDGNHNDTDFCSNSCQSN